MASHQQDDKGDSAPVPAVEDVRIPSEELTINAEASGGRQYLPLDLPTALRLGDANSLEISLARNRLEAAYINEKLAQAELLPDLLVGPNYQYHDGRIQRAIGEIFDTRRNSLFVGGGPVLSWDIADVLYDRLVAHQIVHARNAAVGASRNQALLEVVEGYLDLLNTHAALAIAGETKSHAERLVNIIGSFAKRGAGRTSYRVLSEFEFRRQQERLARERTVIAAATLARRLHIDPRVQLIPLDKHVVPIDLLPMECDPNFLVDIALHHRPEVEEGRWLLSAAVHRTEKARLAPLLPQLIVGYSAGSFGGGYAGSPDSFFGNIGGRQDLQASAVWQLKNLGFGDRYRIDSQQLELENSQLQLARMIDKVSEEVIAAHEMVVSRREQMTATKLAVTHAIDSIENSVKRIREGTALPIEALQSIQSLDRARLEYLQTLTAYNKAQFRLFAAIGNAGVDAETMNQSDGASVPSPE